MSYFKSYKIGFEQKLNKHTAFPMKINGKTFEKIKLNGQRRRNNKSTVLALIGYKVSHLKQLSRLQ